MSDVSNAPDQRDRSHLENSRPFPWDRTSSAPGWPSAVDDFLALLEASEPRRRARRSVDRERLRETLGAMLLGLYGAYKADPEQWLGYSRDSNSYGPRNRYVHPQASSTTVTKSADFLARRGLADHRRGSYRRGPFSGRGGSGFVSRIRARPALVDLLDQQFGLSPDSLGYADWAELVRLKAAPEFPRGPKRLIPYEDDDNTRKMRQRLRELNAFLGGFRIDLEPGCEVPADDQDDVDQEDRASARDRSAVRLYRVFNNGRWDHGGRFYGGWWQGLARQDRRRRAIDGEETVELDFKALHPRLCYHLEGHPLPPDVDPYVLPGDDGARLRDAVKTAFNQLVNVTGDVRLRAPPGTREALPRRLSYRRLLERIEEAHGAIRGWLRQGRGVELQRIDSEIASSILDHLMHRGVCCLPVHDSFIVPRSAEFVLGQTMCLAYEGQLSRWSDARAWPVIAGWTSPEVEQRVLTSLDVPVR